MKKNRLFNEKDIRTALKYTTDLPSLEKKFRILTNTILDLEIKKKELAAQLIDLEHVINQYQHDINIEKEKFSKMEARMPRLLINPSHDRQDRTNELHK
jgi:hypothetical protein